MGEDTLPKFQDLLWPTLAVVQRKGGSAANEEIPEAVISLQGFTNQQQAVLHKDGPKTEIEYRLAWARSYLKGMGLLTNSQRGVWSLTPAGSQLVAELAGSGSEEEALISRLATLRLEYRRRRREPRKLGGPAARHEEDGEQGVEQSWKETLLATLTKMDPSGFERLAQRLLREAGFVSVTVTGRSGDGGIDGLGVYRVSLLSFPVFFQCKRYQGSVGSSAVRNFRGAMAGRGDKGLLITTGSFTQDAKDESTRDGAPPIDLIDGNRLCDLLKDYQIGVSAQLVEEVVVDGSFYGTI